MPSGTGSCRPGKGWGGHPRDPQGTPRSPAGCCPLAGWALQGDTLKIQHLGVVVGLFSPLRSPKAPIGSSASSARAGKTGWEIFGGCDSAQENCSAPADAAQKPSQCRQGPPLLPQGVLWCLVSVELTLTCSLPLSSEANPPCGHWQCRGDLDRDAWTGTLA